MIPFYAAAAAVAALASPLFGAFVYVHRINGVTAREPKDDKRCNNGDCGNGKRAPNVDLGNGASSSTNHTCSGNVTNQAMSIRAATFQSIVPPLLAQARADDEPEQTVVERAKPKWEETKMVVAELASAANLRRCDFGKALAQRANYTPTTHVGAQCNCEAAHSNNPQLRTRTRRLQADGNKGKGDDAHGLLGVISAMGKRYQACRNGLTMTEARLYILFVQFTDNEIY